VAKSDGGPPGGALDMESPGVYLCISDYPWRAVL